MYLMKARFDRMSTRLRIWVSGVRISPGAPFSETFRAIRTAIARRKVLSLLKNLFGLGICLPATQPGPVFLPGPGRIATHSLRRFSRSDYRLLAGGVLDDGRGTGPPNPLGAPMPVVVRAGW